MYVVVWLSNYHAAVLINLLPKDIKSATGIINNLLYLTPNRGLMYVGDLVHNNIVHRLEHLSCFLPGLMALGAHTLDLPPDQKELHEWAAHGLAYTCATSYADQATGLGPDEMTMPTGKKWIDEVKKWKDAGRVGTPPGMQEPPTEKSSSHRDYVNSWSNAYLLRPEVRFFYCKSFLGLLAYGYCADCREYLLHVADNWRRQMAGTRLRDLPGY